MGVLNRISALSATMAVSAALAVVPAAHASAASNCWDGGFKVSDPGGGVYEAYWCHNVNTAAYIPASYDDSVGSLDSNPSWFACKTDSGAWNGEGSPHPYRWVWTEADDGEWGWVPDSDIIDETNPIPYC
jgi:hypothetical protein